MEDVLVSGVSLDLNEAKVTLQRVPDRPGLASRIFTPIAEANIVVDMIIQNASDVGFTDVTFTVPKTDLAKASAITKKIADEIGASGLATKQEVAKVSVVGLGMRSHAGVAARMFKVLSDNGINIEMISTSEIKVSVVVAADQGERAVRALHEALIEKADKF